MAQKICIVVDHRSRTDKPKTREFGGVTKPHHGLKINSKVEQLCIAANIRGVCLRGEDYDALAWALRAPGGAGGSIGVAFPGDSTFFLNTTYLSKYQQSAIDFVCLHEVSHILLPSEGEDAVNVYAISIAKQLGITVPTAINQEGMVLPEKKKKKK